MSETTYSQRYASGDSNTAGTFAFDTISAKDYAVSKLAFGAVGSVTYVSASDPLPVTISGGATSALQTTGNGYLATLAGAVSGTEVQVDVLTMPQVTVVGTGTFAVQAAQSGNWNIVNISGTVSLPTGASTLTEQQSQTTHLATLAGAVAGTEVQVDIVSGSVTISSGSITADTELPAAALLADNTANPTVPGVGAFGHVYDGSTWDRMPGTSADGVLVNLGSNNDVTVTGSVTANAGTNLNTSALALESGGNLAAAATSLAVIDDWDESDRAKVNLIVGQAGIAAGAGAVGATVPRVTLASDDPAVALLTTIDADTSALAAIDYVVGADVASLGVVGNGLAATALRVTVASDSTGTITVTQGTATNLKTQAEAYQGGSAVGAANPLQVTLANGSVPSHAVTNAGTFAVQVDGTALTRLTDIETNTDSGAVVGNGAAATAQRVTIANDSTGILAGVTTVTTVTTCSTVTTLTGGGVAHDSADSGNPHKIGAKAETSPKGITLVADGDRTDCYADADGMLMVKLNTSGADVISEAVSNTDGASTAFTNFSAVASTKNYITAYHIFRTDAGTTPIYVDFRDGTAGSVLWRVVIPPNSGANSPACAGPALFKTSANTALAYDVSAATTTVYIQVSGYQSKV